MGNSKKLNYLNKHKQEQVNASVNNTYPKFSFEYCFNGNKSLLKANAVVKKALISKIITFSQLTWAEIKDLPKNSGFEKIEKNQFNSTPGLPKEFEDINKIDVCRLGRDTRLIGYIQSGTFYAVWVDSQLDMYNH